MTRKLKQHSKCDIFSGIMIDIHSHILPYLDDGPKDMETSLKMAVSYVKAGFSAVVATPHLIKGTRWDYHPQEVLDAVGRFQEMLDQRSIPLKIYSGMEVAVTDSFLTGLNLTEMLPLAESDCYLIEPPFNERLGHRWEKILDIIRLSGKRVILAHPERCLEFQEDKMIISALVKSGVFVQVNMGSLTGVFGKEAMKTASYMLEKGCIHFLASDSHDVRHRRPPAATDLETLGRRYGDNTLKMLFKTNPSKLVASEEIATVMPEYFYQGPDDVDIIKGKKSFFLKKYLKIY